MERVVLVINPGSSSNEYAVYRGSQMLLDGYYEPSNDTEHRLTLTGQIEETRTLTDNDFVDSLQHFLDVLQTVEYDIAIEVVGVRLVAPGRRFLKHQVLDDELIAYLESIRNRAPLHIQAELQQIRAVQQFLPHLPMYAISDSAFHHSLSHEARNYAIPRDDANAYDIYRYGYHGLSVQSIVHQMHEDMKLDLPHVIVCHMGSGSSITALRDGRSTDTSMGYSPLEGLVMATRSGTIDIKAAIELKNGLGLTDDGLIDYLNHSCGLLGLSNISNDIRILLDREARGDTDAAFALSEMVYRMTFYIGAYSAILGGLDAIVFTATAGERSAILRRRICESLAHLGIDIDTTINDRTDTTRQCITKPSSKIAVYVIPTDETAEIARQTIALSD